MLSLQVSPAFLPSTSLPLRSSTPRISFILSPITALAESFPSTTTVPRRRFNSLLTALAAAAFTPKAAFAFNNTDQNVSVVEENDVFGYSFKVPSKGWTRSSASISSFRTVIVYLSDEDSDSNINMVTTPVPGDFQKLTSFGLLENVLVRNLQRCFLPFLFT